MCGQHVCGGRGHGHQMIVYRAIWFRVINILSTCGGGGGGGGRSHGHQMISGDLVSSY